MDTLAPYRKIAEARAKELVDSLINGRKEITWSEMIDQMIKEDKEVIIKNMREDMQQIRKCQPQ